MYVPQVGTSRAGSYAAALSKVSRSAVLPVLSFLVKTFFLHPVFDTKPHPHPTPTYNLTPTPTERSLIVVIPHTAPYGIAVCAVVAAGSALFIFRKGMYGGSPGAWPPPPSGGELCAISHKARAEYRNCRDKRPPRRDPPPPPPPPPSGPSADEPNGFKEHILRWLIAFLLCFSVLLMLMKLYQAEFADYRRRVRIFFAPYLTFARGIPSLAPAVTRPIALPAIPDPSAAVTATSQADARSGVPTPVDLESVQGLRIIQPLGVPEWIACLLVLTVVATSATNRAGAVAGIYVEHREEQNGGGNTNEPTLVADELSIAKKFKGLAPEEPSIADIASFRAVRVPIDQGSPDSAVCGEDALTVKLTRDGQNKLIGVDDVTGTVETESEPVVADLAKDAIAEIFAVAAVAEAVAITAPEPRARDLAPAYGDETLDIASFGLENAQDQLLDIEPIFPVLEFSEYGKSADTDGAEAEAEKGFLFAATSDGDKYRMEAPDTGSSDSVDPASTNSAVSSGESITDLTGCSDDESLSALPPGLAEFYRTQLARPRSIPRATDIVLPATVPKLIVIKATPPREPYVHAPSLQQSDPTLLSPDGSFIGEHTDEYENDMKVAEEHTQACSAPEDDTLDLNDLLLTFTGMEERLLDVKPNYKGYNLLDFEGEEEGEERKNKGKGKENAQHRSHLRPAIHTAAPPSSILSHRRDNGSGSGSVNLRNRDMVANLRPERRARFSDMWVDAPPKDKDEPEAVMDSIDMASMETLGKGERSFDDSTDEDDKEIGSFDNLVEHIRRTWAERRAVSKSYSPVITTHPQAPVAGSIFPHIALTLPTPPRREYTASTPHRRPLRRSAALTSNLGALDDSDSLDTYFPLFDSTGCSLSDLGLGPSFRGEGSDAGEGTVSDDNAGEAIGRDRREVVGTFSTKGDIWAEEKHEVSKPPSRWIVR